VGTIDDYVDVSTFEDRNLRRYNTTHCSYIRRQLTTRSFDLRIALCSKVFLVFLCIFRYRAPFSFFSSEHDSTRGRARVAWSVNGGVCGEQTRGQARSRMYNIQLSIARFEFGFPRNGVCGKTSRERIASLIVSIALLTDRARKHVAL
jgi:hypothetical protein